jgi:hypothetical protein
MRIPNEDYLQRVQLAKRDYYNFSRPIVRDIAAIPGRPRMLIKDGKVISSETIYSETEAEFLQLCRSELEGLANVLRRAYGL